MSKKPKLWKRAEPILSAVQGGKRLCKLHRQMDTGETDVVFFLEPGGAPRRNGVGPERHRRWRTCASQRWPVRARNGAVMGVVVTSMQLAALRILANRLRHYHLVKCGITSRRSEAEHLIEMLRQVAEGGPK